MTAAVIGNALECYDFLTYAFFAIAIGHAFFPAKTPFISLMLSLSTFGAGFLTRPLGAFLLGRLADKAGRKPAMLVSFTLMGVSMLMMAAAPTYAQIGWLAPVIVVTTRLLQGLSVGGEIGVATTWLIWSRSRRRTGGASAAPGSTPLRGWPPWRRGSSALA
jgi:MHS family citrate/tricarballylate:H+ symporter-like MFS transporter